MESYFAKPDFFGGEARGKGEERIFFKSENSLRHFASARAPKQIET